MVLIHSISFVEPHRSSNKCASWHKSNVHIILDYSRYSPLLIFGGDQTFILYSEQHDDLVVHLQYCNCYWIPFRWKLLCVYVKLILSSLLCHFLVVYRSNEYQCWTAYSRYDLPACRLNALVIPSCWDKSWWTIPVFLVALYDHYISFL